VLEGKIGDFFEIKGGKRLPKGSAFSEEKTSYPYLRVTDFQRNGLRTEGVKYIDAKTQSVIKNYTIDSGSVYISIAGTIGIAGIIPALFHGANLTENAAKFVPKKGVQINNKFFSYFLNSTEIQNIIKSKTMAVGVPKLALFRIQEIPIKLPPLAEQQKIAAILDAADSLRQKDRQLVEKYTALSQSLFLEMFGDPVTNPMGWERSFADTYIDLLTGFAFKSKEYSSNRDDIHLCGGLIITPSGIEWSKANYWSRDKLDGLEKYEVIEGDIVMAMDRPWISSGFKIHKITKNDKASLLVQRTARIRGKNINQDFLYFLYKHPAFERQASTTETTVPHISPNDIRKYELIIPPLDLQNQFAERIQLIEQQKQQAQASLEKSEALFNSLLQRAFTGELTQHLAA
jgi:type I restriction enzyme S subunit